MPTFFEFGIAIVMVAVGVCIVVAFRRYHVAASATRRRRMMATVGLESGIATHADPETKAIMKDVRQRCTKCMSEAMCERWLAGEVGGDNAFCPNAKVFEELLARTAAHAV